MTPCGGQRGIEWLDLFTYHWIWGRTPWRGSKWTSIQRQHVDSTQWWGWEQNQSKWCRWSSNRTPWRGSMGERLKMGHNFHGSGRAQFLSSCQSSIFRQDPLKGVKGINIHPFLPHFTFTGPPDGGQWGGHFVTAISPLCIITSDSFTYPLVVDPFSYLDVWWCQIHHWLQCW